MERHDVAVSQISTSISRFYDSKKPFRIFHGSTNSTRPSQLQRDKLIDTSGLTHILKVDKVQKTAIVEPNVPMDRLVEETLKHGLLPPVVMEFPGITVGGGFAGTSGESSSFRYGFFDRTVNWIEMVLANGEKVTASSIQNSDLFYAAASSFGTLGVTTLLELQLIEATSHVELQYLSVSSMPEAVETLQKAVADNSNDFVDGIVYSSSRIVICTGRLTNEIRPGTKIQSFLRPSDPWFYLHVDKLTRKGTLTSEAIPIVDYLFRYDRGGFWVARYAFKYFITPFNRITRRLLNPFMHTRVMYHALHKSGLGSRYIIQDVAIPYTSAPAFLSYLDTTFTHYPLWLCPLKQSGQDADSAYSLLGKKTNRDMPETMLNFGVWGPGPANRDEFVSWNRQFEQKVGELGGQKWLYAHAYYTEEEFDEIYDRAEYDKLRRKWHAEHLPSVYDKVKVDVEAERREKEKSWWKSLVAVLWTIWPLAGLYGVYHAAFGADYLLPKLSKSKGRKNA